MRKNKFIALSLALSAFLGIAVPGSAVGTKKQENTSAVNVQKQENASQDRNPTSVHENIKKHVSEPSDKKPVANSKKLSLWQLLSSVALGSVVIGELVIKGPSLWEKSSDGEQIPDDRQNFCSIKLPENGHFSNLDLYQFIKQSKTLLIQVEQPKNKNEVKKEHLEFKNWQKMSSGNFGPTFKAQSSYNGRIIRIKEMNFHDEEESNKIKEEFEIWSKLDHINLVSYYKIEVENNYFYIIMELLEGQTFEQYINQNGPLPEKVALNLFAQLSSAVKYCHKNKVLHRDLKPKNIFITERYDNQKHNSIQIKLTDFGLPESIDGKRKLDQARELSHYIAPEIRRNQPYGPEADVWSLGCILYEMVTGKAPFDKNSNVISDFPSPIEEYVSQGTKDLIFCMLEKSPSKRPTIEKIVNILAKANYIPKTD